jgi:hypothetical protein
MSVSEEARKIIRMDGVTIHVVYRDEIAIAEWNFRDVSEQIHAFEK